MGRPVTPAQFTELAQLLKLRQSPLTQAVGAVMVEGISQTEAAIRFGVSQSNLSVALSRVRGQIATAKAVAKLVS